MIVKVPRAFRHAFLEAVGELLERLLRLFALGNLAQHIDAAQGILIGIVQRRCAQFKDTVAAGVRQPDIAERAPVERGSGVQLRGLVAQQGCQGLADKGRCRRHGAPRSRLGWQLGRQLGRQLGCQLLGGPIHVDDAVVEVDDDDRVFDKAKDRRAGDGNDI